MTELETWWRSVKGDALWSWVYGLIALGYAVVVAPTLVLYVLVSICLAAGVVVVSFIVALIGHKIRELFHA